MKIEEFLKKYNFHDARIFDLSLNEKDKTLTFKVENNNTINEELENTNFLVITFKNVSNLKCEKQIEKLDDYLLNIWQSESIKNGIEIIFDNDEFLIIYFQADKVEIQSN